MPSIAAVLKRVVFKVTRREFTTSSGGLQHMELFVGEYPKSQTSFSKCSAYLTANDFRGCTPVEIVASTLS